jgi:hypothetical protein
MAILLAYTGIMRAPNAGKTPEPASQYKRASKHRIYRIIP